MSNPGQDANQHALDGSAQSRPVSTRLIPGTYPTGTPQWLTEAPTRDPLMHRSLIEARRGLCDALDALSGHRAALVVVGSHAVHERTKHLRLVSTDTKDSDLAVVPSLLGDDPKIEPAMRAAGFKPLGEFTDHPRHSRYVHRPGLWGKGFDDTGAPIDQVDLIVPEAMSGGGRRAPRAVQGHGPKAVSMAAGLELAAVDHDLMPIESFDDYSVRDTLVAGYAALICAKAHKIGERVLDRDRTGRDRVRAKDGGDVWRLMAASNPGEVTRTLTNLTTHPTVGPVARTGLAYLHTLIESGMLLDLALLDMTDKADAADIEETVQAWATELLDSDQPTSN